MGKMMVTIHTEGQTLKNKTGFADRPHLDGATTDLVTTSASSAKSVTPFPVGANKNDGTDGGFVTISAIGANLYVVTGPTSGLTAAVPAAGANGPGFPVLTGQQKEFAVKKGDVVAAIEFT